MKTRENITDFKQKALLWANTFDTCCFLDSNHYNDQYANYDFVLAAGARSEITGTTGDAFEKLKAHFETHRSWLFGFFSYDLKNETEDLTSQNPDHLKFPDLYFFAPEYLIVSKNGNIEVLIGAESILSEICKVEVAEHPVNLSHRMQNKLTKATYIDRVKQLQKHIVQGDVYELNFCQEFFAEHAHINPLQIYQQLNKYSPTPFGGYFKHQHHYIISATPERFLCKRGNRLISQPIKGTAKRSTDPAEDLQIRLNLKQDVKEQAENVMIVDLVRHDLTKSAVKGSVQVEELFGIYSFPQVHQMISTISCELNPEVHFVDAIKNAYPMGSMTGAPKVKAMELIEQYEESKRGMYSGSFGCISSDGDFDFNVVIRSILYNAQSEYLSFQVGGAITFQSDPEKEYEECMLKASAMMKVLGGA